MDNDKINNPNEVTTASADPDQDQHNDHEGEEKLFTQRELNEILLKRLKRVKGQADEEAAKDLKAKEESLIQRERDLEVRENVFQCKSYLLEHDLPSDLVDVIDTSDIDLFKKKVEIVAGHLRKNRLVPPVPVGSAEPVDITGGADPIARAFSADWKHVPKQVRSNKYVY